MQYLLMVAISLFGAWLIRDAIVYYANEKYYRFGYNIMLTAWLVIGLAKLIFAI